MLDACGSNLDLTPRYARAPRGERAIGIVPRNTPTNTTLIAARTPQGIGPSMLLTGAADMSAFETYITTILAPTLRPGQIVVCDNLSTHKSPRVAAAIAARGCTRWFLPTYSPDYSPIEAAFAKLKAAWRRAAARTVPELYDTICDSLSTITPTDARNFFRNCGYPIPQAMVQSL